MIKVYGYYPSGNSYKVEMLLTWLEIPYEFIHLDVLQGASHTAEFLAINPNGRIPAVVVEGRPLCESHAILCYFAHGSRFVPEHPFELATMWQWLCFEQYHVEPNIGTARYHLTLLGRDPESIGPMLQQRQEGGRAALELLDNHLKDRPFMLTDRFTLADLSLFAYSHVAEEAGIMLAPYDNLRAWQDRIRSRPGFIPMTT